MNGFLRPNSVSVFKRLLYSGGQKQWRTQEFCSGWGGFNTFSEAVAPYPLVKGSGGSCNLVQDISFHIVKVS